MRPKARILDVDGTIFDVSGIRHLVMGPDKDFHAFHTAAEFSPPIPQANAYAEETHRLGMVCVVVTARMDDHLASTTRALRRVMPVPFDGPIMRQSGDLRPDYLVKLEILRYLLRHYDIRGAIDDNPSVIALWEAVGIPVEVVPGFDHDAAKAYRRSAVGKNVLQRLSGI